MSPPTPRRAPPPPFASASGATHGPHHAPAPECGPLCPHTRLGDPRAATTRLATRSRRRTECHLSGSRPRTLHAYSVADVEFNSAHCAWGTPVRARHARAPRHCCLSLWLLLLLLLLLQGRTSTGRHRRTRPHTRMATRILHTQTANGKRVRSLSAACGVTTALSRKQVPPRWSHAATDTSETSRNDVSHAPFPPVRRE